MINATDVPEHALHARFLRGLEKSPDRPAVRVGDQVFTYRQVHERALLLAGSLLAANQPAAVGLLTDKNEHTYIGLLAALYAGATVVPLHPDFPTTRTRAMLRLAGVSALLTDARGSRQLAALLAPAGDEPALDVPVLAMAGVLDVAATVIPVDPAHALRRPRPVEGSDNAYMLFTSGSTGQPKGVPITHANTHHYFQLLDERYDFGPQDVFSQTFDVNFDCAMFDLFCAWGAGAEVCVVPPAAYRDMPAFIAERGMTVWFSTPSAITLIRKMSGLAEDTMPTLRWSFFAGEALRCADAADWQRAAGASTVENLYGPTELTVTVTGHRWDETVSTALAVNGLVPIGSVHDGHERLLLGPDGDPAAGEGELCIAGPQLTAGYLDPRDDDGRFLSHDGLRWYRTGDRVRVLDNGELAYLGRLDAQVQVQGWRVELAEIDNAVRGCPGVRDAVTVTRSVDGTTELVVFYTGAVTPLAALARRLRDVLPQGMLPRHYEHVAEFPLNSNRKIDRSKLASAAVALPSPV